MPVTIATWNPQKLEPWINPNDARTQALQFAASLTVARGTLLGQLTASGKATPYVPGGSGGAQKWLYIARYDFTTDANGIIALGGAGSVPDVLHTTELTEIAFWRGAFLLSQLNVGGAAIDGTTITNASILTDGPVGARYYGLTTGTYIYVP